MHKSKTTMTRIDKLHCKYFDLLNDLLNKDTITKGEYDWISDHLDSIYSSWVNFGEHNCYRDPQANSFACSKCGIIYPEEAGAAQGFICEDCADY